MSDWWARHAGASPAPQPQPQPQYYAPMPTPPAPPPQRNRVPQSALMGSGICPSCGSGEYMAAPGSTYKRCFSCGYPLQQAGSGVGGTSTHTGATKHATQVPTSGYHPGVIVGRVE